MSVDGAERRKQRIDELAAAIQRCGDAGISFSGAVAWATREQGIREGTAREHLRILQTCGEIRLDARSGGRFYYVQTRGKQKVLETP